MPSLIYIKFAKLVVIAIILFVVLALVLSLVHNALVKSVTSEARREREETVAKEFAEYKKNTSASSGTTITKTLILQLGDDVLVGPFKLAFTFYDPSSKRAVFIISDPSHGAVKYDLCLSDFCPNERDFSMTYTDEVLSYTYVITGNAMVQYSEDVISAGEDEISKYEGVIIVVNAELSVMSSQ